MPTAEEVHNYVSPPVEIGDQVLFFTDADPNLNPYVGIVTHLDGRAVEVITMTRHGLQTRPEVHHITDPVLKVNDNIKKFGAWMASRKATDAANVHTILKAYEDRTDTRIRELEEKIQRMMEASGIKEHAPPAVVPEVPVEPITPADVGLSPSQFMPQETQIIEAGQAKNKVNWEKIRVAIGAATMRSAEIAAKLGASQDQVKELLKTNPDVFEHIGAGWFKNK